MSVRADYTVATAVSSWVSPEYQRARGADGSDKPEGYALLYGGRLPGTAADATVERVSYPELAKVAVPLLAAHGYVLQPANPETRLLVVLHWGVTSTYNRENYETGIATLSSSMTEMRNLGMMDPLRTLRGTGDPQLVKPIEKVASAAFETALLQTLMENRVREYYNNGNANLLGYGRDIEKAADLPQTGGLADRYNDLIREIEEPRYYIIIPAYDLQVARQGGKPKLLWITRVSVSARRSQFDRSVAVMLKSAAKYFGRGSGGLVRSEVNGRVELGELKSLGPVEESARNAVGGERQR